MSVDFDDPAVVAAWYRQQYRDILTDPDDQVNRLLGYAILDLAGDIQAQAALFAELEVWVAEAHQE